MATATINLDDESVHIPGWVIDLASFRKWYQSDDFPKQGRLGYLDGGIVVDLSMEQFFSHNQVRTEFGAVLHFLVKSDQLGRFVTDGMLLSNVEADFATEPDGAFLSHETLNSGQVRLLEGSRGGAIELEGTPDMVLEIVSDSSVRKDTVALKAAYAEAGIREYWLVDARGEKPSFDIFSRSAKGYVAGRKQAGWLKSAVFGKSFRLVQSVDKRGDPVFTLEVR